MFLYFYITVSYQIFSFTNIFFQCVACVLMFLMTTDGLPRCKVNEERIAFPTNVALTIRYRNAKEKKPVNFNSYIVPYTKLTQMENRPKYKS